MPEGAARGQQGVVAQDRSGTDRDGVDFRPIAVDHAGSPPPRSVGVREPAGRGDPAVALSAAFIVTNGRWRVA